MPLLNVLLLWFAFFIYFKCFYFTFFGVVLQASLLAFSHVTFVHLQMACHLGPRAHLRVGPGCGELQVGWEVHCLCQGHRDHDGHGHTWVSFLTWCFCITWVLEHLTFIPLPASLSHGVAFPAPPYLKCGAALWSLISTRDSALAFCLALVGVLYLHEHQGQRLQTPRPRTPQLGSLLRFWYSLFSHVSRGFLLLLLSKATCYHF